MNFRNSALVFFASFSVMNLHAQDTSPQVFGTLGSTIGATEYSMSYQLGEAIASTLSHDVGIMNQGFIQSELLITTSTSSPVQRSLTLYPNPTTAEIYITGFNQESGFWSLHDATGRLHASGIYDHHSFALEHRIHVAHLPPGFYILSARTRKGATFQPAPFIKF